MTLPLHPCELHGWVWCKCGHRGAEGLPGSAEALPNAELAQLRAEVDARNEARNKRDADDRARILAWFGMATKESR